MQIESRVRFEYLHSPWHVQFETHSHQHTRPLCGTSPGDYCHVACQDGNSNSSRCPLSVTLSLPTGDMLSLLRCVSAWQNKTHLLGPRTYYYCHASADCLSDVLTKPHSQGPEPLLAGDSVCIDQADGEAKRRDNSRSVEGRSVVVGGVGGCVCPEICLVNMHIRLDVLRYSMGRWKFHIVSQRHPHHLLRAKRDEWRNNCILCKHTTHRKRPRQADPTYGVVLRWFVG